MSDLEGDPPLASLLEELRAQRQVFEAIQGRLKSALGGVAITGLAPTTNELVEGIDVETTGIINAADETLGLLDALPEYEPPEEVPDDVGEDGQDADEGFSEDGDEEIETETGEKKPFTVDTLLDLGFDGVVLKLMRFVLKGDVFNSYSLWTPDGLSSEGEPLGESEYHAWLRGRSLKAALEAEINWLITNGFCVEIDRPSSRNYQLKPVNFKLHDDGRVVPERVLPSEDMPPPKLDVLSVIETSRRIRVALREETSASNRELYFAQDLLEAITALIEANGQGARMKNIIRVVAEQLNLDFEESRGIISQFIEEGQLYSYNRQGSLYLSTTPIERAKPSAPEAKKRVETFSEEDIDLAQKVLDAIASKDVTKKVLIHRLWVQLGKPGDRRDFTKLVRRLEPHASLIIEDPGQYRTQRTGPTVRFTNLEARVVWKNDSDQVKDRLRRVGKTEKTK